MTKKEALAQLKATRKLSTGMLKPFGISFESFLRFAQLPNDQGKQMIERLIEMMDK